MAAARPRDVLRTAGRGPRKPAAVADDTTSNIKSACKRTCRDQPCRKQRYRPAHPIKRVGPKQRNRRPTRSSPPQSRRAPMSDDGNGSIPIVAGERHKYRAHGDPCVQANRPDCGLCQPQGQQDLCTAELRTTVRCAYHHHTKRPALRNACVYGRIRQGQQRPFPLVGGVTSDDASHRASFRPRKQSSRRKADYSRGVEGTSSG